MAISEYKNGNFEEIGAWLQILQIVGNSTLFLATMTPLGNQIRVVAFNVPQLTQASFLQKNQTLQNVFLISVTLSLSSLQKSEYLKLIILIFNVKNWKNQCELDVRVIACNFQVFGIFSFFSVFFRSNSFIFEPKVEKIYMGVFSTHFVPLISILAKRIMEE